VLLTGRAANDLASARRRHCCHLAVGFWRRVRDDGRINFRCLELRIEDEVHTHTHTSRARESSSATHLRIGRVRLTTRVNGCRKRTRPRSFNRRPLGKKRGKSEIQIRINAQNFDFSDAVACSHTTETAGLRKRRFVMRRPGTENLRVERADNIACYSVWLMG
jgi:hypothetical protein